MATRTFHELEHGLRPNRCPLCDCPQSGWEWVAALGCCYRWEAGELLYRTLPICADCAMEHADAESLADELAPLFDMDNLERVGTS
jgi:hypothetical protein